MPYFLVLLIDVLCAVHIARSGRSYFWYLPIFLFPGGGAVIYIAYVAFTEGTNSTAARRFADNVANVADPGRSYREKLRQVQEVGSADTRRALAEECIRRGQFQDAADLYMQAMKDPLGENDVALTRGLARALLLAGDGKGSVAAFEKLRQLDPVAVDADVELDYARALALTGRDADARRQFERILPRYPGEEARCRYALYLEDHGEAERADALFREIVESVRHAPGYYRHRQQEWIRIARQHLGGFLR